MVKMKAMHEATMGSFARFLIQQRMKERGFGYRELARVLQRRFDQEADEKIIGNKVGRGTFSAAFFLMCMSALDSTSIAVKPEDIDFFFRNSPDGGRDGLVRKRGTDHLK
jgi:hypothetical protein